MVTSNKPATIIPSGPTAPTLSAAGGLETVDPSFSLPQYLRDVVSQAAQPTAPTDPQVPEPALPPQPSVGTQLAQAPTAAEPAAPPARPEVSAIQQYLKGQQLSAAAPPPPPSAITPTAEPGLIDQFSTFWQGLSPTTRLLAGGGVGALAGGLLGGSLFQRGGGVIGTLLGGALGAGLSSIVSRKLFERGPTYQSIPEEQNRVQLGQSQQQIEILNQQAAKGDTQAASKRDQLLVHQLNDQLYQQPALDQSGFVKHTTEAGEERNVPIQNGQAPTAFMSSLAENSPVPEITKANQTIKHQRQELFFEQYDRTQEASDKFTQIHNRITADGTRSVQEGLQEESLLAAMSITPGSEVDIAQTLPGMMGASAEDIRDSLQAGPAPPTVGEQLAGRAPPVQRMGTVAARESAFSDRLKSILADRQTRLRETATPEGIYETAKREARSTGTRLQKMYQWPQIKSVTQFVPEEFEDGGISFPDPKPGEAVRTQTGVTVFNARNRQVLFHPNVGIIPMADVETGRSEIRIPEVKGQKITQDNFMPIYTDEDNDTFGYRIVNGYAVKGVRGSDGRVQTGIDYVDQNGPLSRLENGIYRHEYGDSIVSQLSERPEEAVPRIASLATMPFLPWRAALGVGAAGFLPTYETGPFPTPTLRQVSDPSRPGHTKPEIVKPRRVTYYGSKTPYKPTWGQP